MVLFCGSGTNFQTLWDTPGSLNDPNGSKHTWELSHLIDLQENFKSAKVDEWNSLSVSHVSELLYIVHDGYMSFPQI